MFKAYLCKPQPFKGAVRSLSCALACVAFMAAPALAHHGMATKFDPERGETLRGTVSRVDWAFPHVHVFMVVEDDGESLPWYVELESPQLLELNGWNEDTLQPGQQIVVEGFRARDDSRQVWGESIVAGDNELFTLQYESLLDSITDVSHDATPRWPDNQVRLGAPPGSAGYWVPETTVLMEDGANVAMAPNGQLENIADAAKVAPLQTWALRLYESRQRNFLRSDPTYVEFLYVLEYGSVWFGKSDNAKLVRIEYNAGNRKPVVMASTNKQGGTVPLKLTLSSAGTYDADGDKLTYSWKLTSPGVAPKLYPGANSTITITKAGVYMATLTVTDSHGAKNTKAVKIIAGNEAPQVAIDLSGNRSFYFNGKPFDYNVTVDDKEDGSLASGGISPAQVSMSINYTSEGFDYVQVAQEQSSVDASTQFAVAKALIGSSDCKNCHSINAVNVAPSFTDISNKYKGNAEEIERLAHVIRGGGHGHWNRPVDMPAHPGIALADARTIVNYIINVTNNNINTMPLKGSFTPNVPADDNGNGSYLIRAAYTDKGNKNIPKQTTATTIVLHNPVVYAATAPVIKNAFAKVNGLDGSTNVVGRKDGYVEFKKIDLTAIKHMELSGYATTLENNPGGTIEVHIDSPAGAVIGSASFEQLDLKPKNTNWIKTDIKETQGTHDIYFVFKNDKAKPVDALLLFNAIKFEL